MGVQSHLRALVLLGRHYHKGERPSCEVALVHAGAGQRRA